MNHESWSCLTGLIRKIVITILTKNLKMKDENAMINLDKYNSHCC